MMSKPSSSAASKLDGLQVGRALAALSVVLYHASGRIAATSVEGQIDVSYWMRGGNAGVDLFFVISGFVILHAHASDIGRPGALTSYLFRRISRIYPLFWVLCAAVIPLYFLVPSAGEAWQRSFSSIIGTVFLIPVPPKPIIGVAWTLILEMIFYAMFALMIVGGSLGKIVFSIWIAVASLSHFYGKTDFHVINSFFSHHFFGFLLGMTLAYVYRQVTAGLGRAVLAAGIASFASAWCYLVWSGSSHELRPWFLEVWIDISCAAVILGLASAQLNFESRVGRSMRAIGDATYSIYLFHWLFGWFAEKAVIAAGLNGALSPVIAFPAMVLGMTVAGLIVYRVVELPLLDLTRRIGVGRSASGTLKRSPEPA